MIYKCVSLNKCAWSDTCPWAYGIDSNCLDYIKQREENMIIELFYVRAWTNDSYIPAQWYKADGNICPHNGSQVIMIRRRPKCQ